DVDPFAFEHGGQVINFTVDLYHQVTLIPQQNPQLKLEALGESRLINQIYGFPYNQDKKFDLIYAILNFFRSQISTGFTLTVTGPKNSPLGLGRSGSVSVAIIAAFNTWLKTQLTPLEIGLLAANLEIKELGWSGGKQDSLAAAIGGFNLIYFGPGNQVKVEPIKLDQSTLKTFKENIFMIYIGGDRHSSHQQKTLIANMADKKKLPALISLKSAVSPALKALQSADWPALGKILHQAWEDKKTSNPQATNSKINKLYDIAIKHGAYGGKISGSGGAGNMFFIIPPEKKSAAINALITQKAKLIDFNFDYTGVKVATYDR
ncbi:MAG: hypothetical protein U0946_07215, partial [Patescibacteria group bacterium]|nr:hypothetical protein [Patescibacteria group bacterium]